MIVAECCIALSFVQFLRDLSTAAAQPGNKGSGNKERKVVGTKKETMKMRRRRRRQGGVHCCLYVQYFI